MLRRSCISQKLSPRVKHHYGQNNNLLQKRGWQISSLGLSRFYDGEKRQKCEPAHALKAVEILNKPLVEKPIIQKIYNQAVGGGF